MADTAAQLVTVDEFLEWDDGTDRRYQLLRGVITMIAPAQTVHGRLVSRLAARLTDRLRRPCEPIVEAGVKPPHRDDTFYVADVAVTCRPLERGEVYLPEPVLFAEVLSPSTASTDRLLKLPDYRLIPSVMDILLVSTATARLEHWHREDDGWEVVFRGPGERVELAALDTVIALDELYRDLPHEAEEPPPA
jgi:Uma2 family endonuclease